MVEPWWRREVYFLVHLGPFFWQLFFFNLIIYLSKKNCLGKFLLSHFSLDVSTLSKLFKVFGSLSRGKILSQVVVLSLIWFIKVREECRDFQGHMRSVDAIWDLIYIFLFPLGLKSPNLFVDVSLFLLMLNWKSACFSNSLRKKVVTGWSPPLVGSVKLKL